MSPSELLRFASRALTGHSLRSGLCLLGVVIGVAAVIVLTALSEGARRYVIDQFASLGTNLVIVLPGRTETTGMPGPGGVPNDLTLEDAEAVSRRVRSAHRVAPIAIGAEEVAFDERRRQVALIGTTASYLPARQLEMERGEFLPDELFRGSPVAVLGHTTAREVFPHDNPLGKIVRVGGWRMRVIGVLEPQGTKLGIDFDETVFVPVQTAMSMLNRSSLFRILIEVEAHGDIARASEETRLLLTERHGEEDVTVVTQDAVLSTFSDILGSLTLALAAIAAVSLSVAGIGIMNVMLVSVAERTREVGLLRALGVARGQIVALFLTEAVLLSAAGGAIGLGLGFLIVRALVRVFPALPASPPPWAIGSSLAVAVVVGAVFGLLPARRAALLDPVAALSGR